MSGRRIISVVTGSSNSGRACMDAILGDATTDVIVRGAFRTVEKATESRSRHHGGDSGRLETVHGVNAYDEATLGKAFAGASATMIVTPLDHARGMGDDALLTKRMIDVALAQGVVHIVLIGSWTTHVPHALPGLAGRFVEPEEYLVRRCEELQVAHTILRGGFFSSNYSALAHAIRDGGHEGVIRASTYCVASCDPQDLGRMAAAVLLQGSARHSGKCYEVTGSRCRHLRDVVHVIGEKLGKSLRLDVIPSKEFVKDLPQPFKELFVYLEEKGPNAVPCTDHFERVTGLPPASLEQWVSEHLHLFK